MSKPFITAETKVVDVLEYGQGDDGEIAEIFKAFKQFRDGYYELVNWGDDWCRKGIPCEYATINGFCQLTACLKRLRERKE